MKRMSRMAAVISNTNIIPSERANEWTSEIKKKPTNIEQITFNELMKQQN